MPTLKSDFALVLGGGGITGGAWEAGLLKGLRDQGIDLAGAGLIVGTSAGAYCGAATAHERLDAFFEHQLGPVDPAVERAVTVEPGRLAAAMGDVAQDASGYRPPAGLARLGQAALAARYEFTPEERLRTMASRIGADTWPERPLMVTAIACDDGSLTVWTKDSGIPLLAAVASSCAAPFVYPPQEISGRHYIDGGLRSGVNADLAQGWERIVIVAPVGRLSPFAAGLALQIEALRRRETTVWLLDPDADARPYAVTNPTDPAGRRGAAEAGYAQATRVLSDLPEWIARSV